MTNAQATQIIEETVGDVLAEEVAKLTQERLEGHRIALTYANAFCWVRDRSITRIFEMTGGFAVHGEVSKETRRQLDAVWPL